MNIEMAMSSEHDVMFVAELKMRNGKRERFRYSRMTAYEVSMRFESSNGPLVFARADVETFRVSLYFCEAQS